MHRKFLYLLYVTCWCLSSFIAGCAGKKDMAGAPVGQPVLMAGQVQGQPSPPPGMRLGMGYMSALNEPCYELYAENEDIPQAQALCYRQGGWVPVPGIYMAVPRGVAPFSHHTALASAAIQASPMSSRSTSVVAAAPLPQGGDYSALFAQAPVQKTEPEKLKNTLRFAGLDDGESRQARKEKTEVSKNTIMTDPDSGQSIPQTDVKTPEKSGTETLVAYIPGIVQSDAPLGVMSSNRAMETVKQEEQPSRKKLRPADLEYTIGKVPLAVFASSLEQSSKLAAGKATKVASISENLLVSFAGRLADINMLTPAKPKSPSPPQPQAVTANQSEKRVSAPVKKELAFQKAAAAPLASVNFPITKQGSGSVKKITVRQKKAALKSAKKRPALGSYVDLLTTPDDAANKATVSGR